MAETRDDRGDDWLAGRLEDAGALLVAGGDGAVQSAAAAAIRTRTPLYQLPYGTENLFAREFGMDRQPTTLLRALRRREVRWVDAADVNGRRFLLMASVGYDAEVVSDLTARRRRSISHWTYLGPMLRQLLLWRPPRLSIAVDGRTLDLRTGRGQVIVANCRQYMWRLDPARRADMSDGLLDVVYMPTRTAADVVAWSIRCSRGTHLAHPSLVYETGRSVRIACDPPRRIQIDGDPIVGGETAEFRVTVEPGVLPVLVPEKRRASRQKKEKGIKAEEREGHQGIKERAQRAADGPSALLYLPLMP